MLGSAPYDAFSARRVRSAPSENYALIITIRKKKSPKRLKTQVFQSRKSKMGVEWGVNAGSSGASDSSRSKYYIQARDSAELEVRKMVNHKRVEKWIESFLWTKHTRGIRFVTTREIHDAQKARYSFHALTTQELSNVMNRIRFGRGPDVRVATYKGEYEWAASWFSLTWRPSQ